MILYPWLLQAIIYMLAGVFAGLMSGILGIGGGIVVVPALLYIFQHGTVIPADLCMHFAAGTSLAIMILTSLSSIRAHLKQEIILWSVYQRLGPGIVLGVICGGIAAFFISSTWLKIFFGLFLLFVATKMLLGVNTTSEGHFPKPWINALISFVIGFKSSLLGVGGGALVIPYLTWCGIEIRRIAAISAVCTMTVAILGTLLFILTGSRESVLPPYSTGFIYWPAVIWVAIPSLLMAPLGAKLNYILPVKQLRYFFITVLYCTAVSLLV